MPDWPIEYRLKDYLDEASSILVRSGYTLVPYTHRPQQRGTVAVGDAEPGPRHRTDPVQLGRCRGNARVWSSDDLSRSQPREPT
jgi:hypothetical protein